MNRHTSAARRRGILRRFTRSTGGTAAIEFAFILPIVLLLTVGLLEFAVVLFDYHRAGEATRRAIRQALINPPIATLDNIATTDIVCDGGGSIVCTGGTVESTADATFSTILSAMQAIFPDIQSANVRITYSASGLDGPLTPGIVTPIVTISVRNLTHAYIVLGIIPGMPSSMTFPSFTTSALGPSESIA